MNKLQQTPSNTSQPLVSVIMNCYNGEKYLREAIDSVYAQTYKNWEIVFWDNQSTDKSAEIARSYDDEKVRYYYAPKHTVLYEARNYAIDESAGEYFAFLDVDDWWDCSKIETQIKLFKHKSIGVTFSNYWLVNEKRNTTEIMYKDKLPSGNITNKLLKNYFVGLCTIMVSRKVISAGYLFNPEYHVIGDFDFVIRTSLKYEIVASQEPLSYYRWHQTNETIKSQLTNIKELNYWYNSNLDIFHNYNNVFCIKMQSDYLQGIKFIKENKYFSALRVIIGLKSHIYKIKLLIYLFFPYIFKKFQRLN
jgi:glycosyltransferase involved in cell wall biosynthesis